MAGFAYRGWTMRVSGILKDKGSDVATVTTNQTLAHASDELRRRRIGALVVTNDGETIEGILSERDVVHAIALFGHAVLNQPVTTAMTAEVWTCSPDDTTEELAQAMTYHRTRHLPVMNQGKLVGIVSIGDIVKSRLTELEREREQLTNYITTGR